MFIDDKIFTNVCDFCVFCVDIAVKISYTERKEWLTSVTNLMLGRV